MLADLADLVLPRRCVGCARAGPPLCAQCRPSGPPLRADAGGIAVWAAGSYAGPLRAAILAYKERGRRELSAPLAGALTRAVEATAALAGPDRRLVLVPVPSSAPARRARGGDHMLRLGRRVSRAGGPRTVAALRLARSVQDSVGLRSEERRANLDGAMVARRPPPPGVRAVLIDDIVTTGATLAEATRALEAAGWSIEGAAVVAATARRRRGEY